MMNVKKLKHLEKVLLRFNLITEANSVLSLIKSSSEEAEGESILDPADVDWEAELKQVELKVPEEEWHGDWLSAIPHSFEWTGRNIELTPKGMNLFYRDGSGSSRAVFGVISDPKFIIKIQKISGDSQNRAEAKIQALEQDLFPKIYAHGGLDSNPNLDYKWIVEDKVRVIEDESEFESFFPELKKILEELNERESKDDPSFRSVYFDFFFYYIITLKDKNRNNTKWLDSAFSEAYTREPLFKKIYNLGSKLGMELNDIRTHNVGVTADGRFVILDVGFHEPHNPIE